ncbi:MULTISPECIES: glycosyl hydrolase family 28-related protein [unclassified Gordonia (in: high G+C Gram-positive bacteria)]|uniref:glycosyl hydrolase family 28-related protein n=1 Tax=unclassified Gordonia (in: high G+C Gram-positive bacteria) TaxID=2657482 RepID=UPI001965E279|nr:hypothetical protein [Gordonia sp. BP-119]MBN0984475.1 hypothetical protein [Gordonia sp. BP-94]
MPVAPRRALLGIAGLSALGAAAGCSIEPTAGPSGDTSDESAATASIVNVCDFGAVGDGQANDTEAISAALRHASGTPELLGTQIYFPPGRYVDRNTHVLRPDRPVALSGAGPGLSVLLREGRGSAPWWDIRTPFCAMTGLTVNSRRCDGSSPAVSINSAYATLDNVHFEDSPDTALSIGAEASAIGNVLNALMFRYSGRHHILVHGENSSTDGRWSNIEAGISGHSGIRVEAAGQNILNLHIWGAGTASSRSNSGIELLSSNNSLGSGWQSEKNLGPGLVVSGSHNVITGGRSWGNAGYGILIEGDNEGNIVSANVFRDNSLADQRRPSGRIVVAVVGGSAGIVAQNVFTQTNQVLTPTRYREQPTFPYMGRRASSQRPPVPTINVRGELNPERLAMLNEGLLTV